MSATVLTGIWFQCTGRLKNSICTLVKCVSFYSSSIGYISFHRCVSFLVSNLISLARLLGGQHMCKYSRSHPFVAWLHKINLFGVSLRLPWIISNACIRPEKSLRGCIFYWSADTHLVYISWIFVLIVLIFPNDFGLKLIPDQPGLSLYFHFISIQPWQSFLTEPLLWFDGLASRTAQCAHLLLLPAVEMTRGQTWSQAAKMKTQFTSLARLNAMRCKWNSMAFPLFPLTGFNIDNKNHPLRVFHTALFVEV